MKAALPEYVTVEVDESERDAKIESQIQEVHVCGSQLDPSEITEDINLLSKSGYNIDVEVEEKLVQRQKLISTA